MSSRTSSRSTLTMVPSTMSPSLKYLIVSSIAARKSSADPMSLIATCAGARVGASVVLAVKGLAPGKGWSDVHATRAGRAPGRGDNYAVGPSGRSSGPAPYETHRPSCFTYFTAPEVVRYTPDAPSSG